MKSTFASLAVLALVASGAVCVPLQKRADDGDLSTDSDFVVSDYSASYYDSELSEKRDATDSEFVYSEYSESFYDAELNEKRDTDATDSEFVYSEYSESFYASDEKRSTDLD